MKIVFFSVTLVALMLCSSLAHSQSNKLQIVDSIHLDSLQRVALYSLPEPAKPDYSAPFDSVKIDTVELKTPILDIFRGGKESFSAELLNAIARKDIRLRHQISKTMTSVLLIIEGEGYSVPLLNENMFCNVLGDPWSRDIYLIVYVQLTRVRIFQNGKIFTEYIW